MNAPLVGTLLLSIPSPAREPTRTATPRSTDFGHVLERVGRELDRGERTLERALEAGPTDAAGMIALQAGIYRYSEAVELTAKLVEHAATGLRTTLQGSG